MATEINNRMPATLQAEIKSAKESGSHGGEQLTAPELKNIQAKAESWVKELKGAGDGLTHEDIFVLTKALGPRSPSIAAQLGYRTPPGVDNNDYARNAYDDLMKSITDRDNLAVGGRPPGNLGDVLSFIPYRAENLVPGTGETAWSLKARVQHPRGYDADFPTVNGQAPYGYLTNSLEDVLNTKRYKSSNDGQPYITTAFDFERVDGNVAATLRNFASALGAESKAHEKAAQESLDRETGSGAGSGKTAMSFVIRDGLARSLAQMAKDADYLAKVADIATEKYKP